MLSFIRAVCLHSALLAFCIPTTGAGDSRMDGTPARAVPVVRVGAVQIAPPCDALAVRLLLRFFNQMSQAPPAPWHQQKEDGDDDRTMGSLRRDAELARCDEPAVRGELCAAKPGDYPDAGSYGATGGSARDRGSVC